ADLVSARALARGRPRAPAGRPSDRARVRAGRLLGLAASLVEPRLPGRQRADDPRRQAPRLARAPVLRRRQRHSLLPYAARRELAPPRGVSARGVGAAVAAAARGRLSHARAEARAGRDAGAPGLAARAPARRRRAGRADHPQLPKLESHTRILMK